MAAPKTIQALATTLPRKDFAGIIGAKRPAAAMIAHGHRKMSLEAVARLAGTYLVPKMGEARAASFLLRSLKEWFPEAFAEPADSNPTAVDHTTSSAAA